MKQPLSNWGTIVTYVWRCWGRHWSLVGTLWVQARIELDTWSITMTPACLVLLLLTTCCLLFVSFCWPLCLQDARQLSSRPPMHCTSIILAVFGLMLLLAYVFQWPSLHHFTWILVAAVVSHHLRDATRRGLWLYPFGSSPPIPYPAYLVGCMLLPHVVPSLMQGTQLAHHPATRPSIELVWDGLMQRKKYCWYYPEPADSPSCPPF